MNRAEVRNLVIEATKRSDKVSLINQAIDIAVAEVSAQRAWSDLLTSADASITAGSTSVELASDLTRLQEVRLIDGNNSRAVMIREKLWLMKYYPNVAAQSQGKPVYGYLEGRDLFLIPIPSQTYTLRYTYSPQHPALATDASQVLIRHTSAAIAAFATFWVFQSIEKHTDAERWYATYLTLLAAAMKVDVDNPAVLKFSQGRGSEPGPQADYWLDPFVKSMP